MHRLVQTLCWTSYSCLAGDCIDQQRLACTFCFARGSRVLVQLQNRPRKCSSSGALSHGTACAAPLQRSRQQASTQAAQLHSNLASLLGRKQVSEAAEAEDATPNTQLPLPRTPKLHLEVSDGHARRAGRTTPSRRQRGSSWPHVRVGVLGTRGHISNRGSAEPIWYPIWLPASEPPSPLTRLNLSGSSSLPPGKEPVALPLCELPIDLELRTRARRRLRAAEEASRGWAAQALAPNRSCTGAERLPAALVVLWN